MDVLDPSNDASFAADTETYTGTAGTTATWPVGPNAVLVWCTTDAYVKVGVGVTATVASMPIPANTPILFKVPPEGDPWRVSAIQISAGGSVYAKPVNGATG
jgi:hypothetical protein